MGYIADSNLIHKNTNKRTTFVYMASSMREGVGLKIWQGILKKTRAIEANLICYMGGEFGGPNTSLIYNLINLDNIDGIINWAVSFSNRNESFYNKFKGFPFIALSVPVSGFPVVMADSYLGMKEVVEHLVKVHSYTKIAFVRGPEKHNYAEQRYKAYLDVVKENNIYNENLITAPLTWEPSSGLKGISILLDERNLKPGKDIEAVVFISDNHAIAVYDELTQRKIKIPEQLAITGFNATQEAFCTTSPITNVEMPFFEQGNTAVNLLVKLLNKEEISMNTTLPAKLIIAQSCGCQSPLIENAVAKVETISQKEEDKKFRIFSLSRKQSKSMSGEAITEDIIKELKEYTQNNKFIGPMLLEYSEILLEALFNEIENNRTGEFLLRLDNFIRELINEEKEFEFLQEIISIFRRKFYLSSNKTSTIYLLENLWSQARILIAEASSRAKDKETLKRLKQETTLREISVSLITNYNVDKLMNLLVESLPKLKIPGCYISLYENPADLTYDADLQGKAKLIFAYENGKRKELKSEGIIYPAKDLLPEVFSRDSGQKSTMVQPLNFNDIQMGFVIYEVGPEEGTIYFILSNLLSSALYGALLYQKNKNVNLILHKTLNNVKLKSEVVSEKSNNINNNINDISSSMESVAANLREMSKNNNHVMEIVKNAVDIAKNANIEIITLTNKSQEISEITSIISNMAEQTKILAINASIEAARAGEKGKGFSIVAKEVRNLAKRTALSTDNIATMIKTIQSQTNETADTISQVVNTIDKVLDLSFSITSSIAEQAAVTNEISDVIITAAEGTKEIYQAISELVKLANADEDEA